jgi:exonuclease SbcC
VLARALQPGVPCPVCGSAGHPAPAAHAHEVPAQATLNAAREAEEAARRAHEEARVALVRIDEATLALRATRTRLDAELGEWAATPLAELEQQAVLLRADVQALQAARDGLQEQEKLRAECLARLSAHAGAVESARAASATATLAEAEAEAALHARQDQLPAALRATGALAETLGATSGEAARLGAQIEAATLAHQQARESLARAQADAGAAASDVARMAALLQAADAAWAERLAASPFADIAAFHEALLEPEALQRLQQGLRDRDNALLLARRAVEESTAAIAGAGHPDLAALEQEEIAARNASETAIGELHVLGDRRATLEKTRAALGQLLAEQDALEAEYAVVGRLARIANGGNAYNLSLQRFVLSVLLDEVLVEAGHRLRVMSRGRYQLSRREEVRDARSKSGLELDVEDAYTGRVRSVATLSGGESFMAALALALGLSDVVQAHSGGIRLDTLFIDEGFGSLDADALDLAIRTLIDLQASGRMVGIISHVPELKQQMDVQVVVEPGASGSHLRLVGP